MKRKLISILVALAVFFAGSVTVYSARADTPPAGPTYIVQSGDTLWSIAQRFDVNVADLQSINNLSDPTIYIGEKLVIPGLPGLSGTLNTVTVQYGQTLLSLARQYRMDEATLIMLNHLVSPMQLYAGYGLVILQQDNQSYWTDRASLSKGETLLELAVQQKTDPWTLAQANALAGPSAALPGDMLYLPTDKSASISTGLPPVFTSVAIDALPIVQGKTLQIKIVPSQSVTLSGSVMDHPLHFYPAGDGSYVALQGIEANATPGLYPLDLQAVLPDGSLQSFEQNVPVISGNYPHDTTIYYVKPDTIDPAYTVPDAAKVRAFTAASTADKYWQGAFKSPASLFASIAYISSPFGIGRSYVGVGTKLTLDTFHTGMDYAAGTGQPITAPADGIVVFTGPLVVCGNATYIYHGWGVYSGICHQSSIKVTVGQMVHQGDLIGLVGDTGRALGPNLHWEVWVNGVQVNPTQWLNEVFPH
ncbi:MAG: LysM peptidoglycan-binding domain-containing protein [Anaerolineales bacterium]